MSPNPPAQPGKSFLKNPYSYSSVVLILVAIYVGYILISRYESRREFDRRNGERQTEKQRRQDRLAVEQLGGSELAIHALYLSPAIIRRGQPAQLCYDVANAKTVTLDPSVAEVWPSHSRCIDLSVTKSTTFTLTIADAAGHIASQSVDLKVQ